MSKDHIKRQTYRKSPGRQYGYNYDPLKSHAGVSQSGASAANSKTGALVQRPDPKRTRQIMRQSIIDSKRNSVDDEDQLVGVSHGTQQPASAEQYAYTPSRRRRLQRETEVLAYAQPRTTQKIRERDIEEHVQPEEYAYQSSGRRRVLHENDLEDYMPTTPSIRSASLTRHLTDDDLYPETSSDTEDPYGKPPAYWYQEAPEDADPGNDDLPADYMEEEIPVKRKENKHPPVARRLSSTATVDLPEPKLTRHLEPEVLEAYPEVVPEYPEESEKYDYEYEEEYPSVRRPRRSKSISRRGLLLGAGVAAVAGAGVAAYELVPKVPDVVGTASSNIEHQIQTAFNQGLTQGANQARTELMKSLQTIEGFTLDGAITSARLTRDAYDVFVSPIIKFGSAVTSDFLNGMLKAFKTARQWLQGVYQDNATLAAIENVLSAWVTQVNNMPKQLDAITETDLDGAQSYLRELQRQLTTTNTTATPTSTAKKQ